MSSIDTFTDFPRLPLELRLLIWDLALVPRIIYFKHEIDKSIQHPGEVLNPARPLLPFRGTRRQPGRCVLSKIPPQAVLHTCQEARNFAFSIGYRAWTAKTKYGTITNMIWSPARDFIAFPINNDTIPNSRPAKTSLWSGFPFRGVQIDYVRKERWLNTLSSLRELVMVVDESYERSHIRRHFRKIRERDPDISWKLPQDILQRYEIAQKSSPNQNLRLPDVRVVGDFSGVLRRESLEATLRCYPCEYLGIGVGGTEEAALPGSTLNEAGA